MQNTVTNREIGKLQRRVSFRAERSERGERTRLACCFPRPRGKIETSQQTSVAARAKMAGCFRVVGEGAADSTRGVCAPLTPVGMTRSFFKMTQWTASRHF